MGSDQAVCEIVHLGITANLGEITTYQSEIMVLIDATYSSNSFHGRLVAYTASKRITRIGGIYDHSTASRNGHRTADQTLLRVRWMNLQVLTHLCDDSIAVIRVFMENLTNAY